MLKPGLKISSAVSPEEACGDVVEGSGIAGGVAVEAGPTLDRAGPMLDSRWTHTGLILGPCWTHAVPTLDPCWTNAGLTPDPESHAGPTVTS